MDILFTIFSLLVLLFSVVIHELAHGSIAYSLGDLTAKYQGRLTLNPIKHLDLFGSIILPLVLFISGSPVLVGWAKPVPINPYNFRDQKWGSLKVAIAGPLTNLFLAIFFGLLIRFSPYSFIVSFEKFFILMAYVVSINIMLALFNLLPIPPLDGHWILFSFLPESFSVAKEFLQRYGFFLLIFLLVFNGLFFLNILSDALFNLIVGK